MGCFENGMNSRVSVILPIMFLSLFSACKTGTYMSLSNSGKFEIISTYVSGQKEGLEIWVPKRGSDTLRIVEWKEGWKVGLI